MRRYGSRRLVSADDITGLDSHPRKIAWIADYLPRKCGIANFTHDLRCGFADRYPAAKCVVAAVDDQKEKYEYPPEVVCEFDEQDPVSYLRMADYLNLNRVDVVCLQHEYGIYGGPCGQMIVTLLRELKMPIVTTLHTILRQPSPEQRKILQTIISVSSKIVTMTAKGRDLLKTVYNAPDDKVMVIAHGIPEMEFVSSEKYKPQFGLVGKKVLLTFGLLSPNKGIEYMIRALPAIVKEFPDIMYVILGQTHPNLIRENGEVYRHSLEWLARDLGVTPNIMFVNKYTDLDLLTQYIGACDIYVTPYLFEEQITSGTLSYAFGMGNAVVSTRYWHAVDLLTEETGRLCPFRDSEALSGAILELLRDPKLLNSMQRKAFEVGRTMTWPRASEHYMNAFQGAMRKRLDDIARRHEMAEEEPVPEPIKYKSAEHFPEVRLDHLLRLSDSIGICQYSMITLPDWHSGYSLEDVCRACLVLIKLHKNGFVLTERMEAAMTSYMAFINYAFDRSAKKFHCLMTFDRKWVDPECNGGFGSEDTFGRALWTLGWAARHSPFSDAAVQLFEMALPGAESFHFLKSSSYALMGLYEFREKFKSNTLAQQIQQKLAELLMEHFKKCADEDWQWLEDNVTYSNGCVPAALILYGAQCDNPEAREIGLKMLTFLVNVQTFDKDGSFWPVGSNGGLPRRGKEAYFDQMPQETADMLTACVVAYRVTGDKEWQDQATNIFDWFMGRNYFGAALFDGKSRGCRDAIGSTGVNMNQGARATTCFLDALVEMRYSFSAQ